MPRVKNLLYFVTFHKKGFIKSRTTKYLEKSGEHDLEILENSHYFLK